MLHSPTIHRLRLFDWDKQDTKLNQKVKDNFSDFCTIVNHIPDGIGNTCIDVINDTLSNLAPPLAPFNLVPLIFTTVSAWYQDGILCYPQPVFLLWGFHCRWLWRSVGWLTVYPYELLYTCRLKMFLQTFESMLHSVNTLSEACAVASRLQLTQFSDDVSLRLLQLWQGNVKEGCKLQMIRFFSLQIVLRQGTDREQADSWQVWGRNLLSRYLIMFPNVSIAL